MSDTRHNPHVKQLFTLKPDSERKDFDPLVEDCRNDLHGASVADADENTEDENENDS